MKEGKGASGKGPESSGKYQDQKAEHHGEMPRSYKDFSGTAKMKSIATSNPSMSEASGNNSESEGSDRGKSFGTSNPPLSSKHAKRPEGPGANRARGI